MDINEAVNYILKSHMKEYIHLEEAKIEIDICGYKYCYDAMSLGQYYSFLPNNLSNNLYKVLKSKLNQTNEQEKERKERYAIMLLSLFKENLKEFTISKLTRPDFVLEDGQKRIGIEVTELCVESVKIIGKIANEFFAKKMPVNVLKRKAIEKHGKKAEHYIYSSAFGHNCIGTNTYDVSEYKKKFAENIINKLKKYEEEAIKYDEMIVLCVHHENIITNKEDAFDVFKLINYFPKNKITVIIIFTNDNYENNCFEKEIYKR